MNARYYNGKIGRFISQDPAYLAVGDYGTLKSKTGQDLQSYLSDPQGFNSYAYARNNPLAYIDETGEYFLFLQAKTNYIAFPTMGEMKSELRNGWNNYMAFRESVGQWAENNPTLYNILTFAASMRGGGAKGGKMQVPGSKSLPEPINGRLGNNIPQMSVENLPRYAQDTFNYYKTNGFDSSRPGYIGGRIFENRRGDLPIQNDPNYYREWDVKSFTARNQRGVERFVTGDNGKEVYWTNTHYGDNPGTPFYKIK